MKAPNEKSLIKALPLIAQSIGRQFGIEVKFGNYPTAFTDGDNIYLPFLPAEGEALAVLANGYIDHEAAHIRHTNFGLFKAVANQPLLKHMLNIIEDLRIEQALIEAFPGCKKHLHKLVAHLVEKGTMSAPDEDGKPVDALVTATLLMGRADVLDQEGVYDEATKAEATLERVVGRNAVVRLRALLNEAKNLNSTQEALDLSHSILKMLKEEQEKNEEEAKQQASDASQSDDSQNDNDQGDNTQGDDQGGDADGGSSGAAGDGDGDDDQDSDSSTSGASGDDSDDDDGADDSSTGSGAGHGNDDASQAQDDPQSISDALKQALEDKDINAKSDLGSIAAGEMSQEVQECDPDELITSADPQRSEPAGFSDADPDGLGSVSIDEVRRETTELRARLRAKIEASLREKIYHGHTGRRIDSRRLPGLRTGDTRVFQKKDEKKGLNTAIELIVDRSGSMNGQPIKDAMKAALATMSALDTLKGVACSATVFPFNEQLKGYDETVKQAQHRFVPKVCGCTPLTEGLIWSAHRFNARPEARKILIVATDGDPDNPVSAKAIIKSMTRSNVEVIGIGMGGMRCDDLFPSHRNIDSVSELAGKLFELLSEKLV